MADPKRLICSSASLENGGPGQRFTAKANGREIPAFVIRFRDRPYAYINECGHIPAELDWQPGELFDDSKLYLICSIHGALYAPDTGRCLTGRCEGRGLKTLGISEDNGNIFLNPD